MLQSHASGNDNACSSRFILSMNDNVYLAMKNGSGTTCTALLYPISNKNSNQENV